MNSLKKILEFELITIGEYSIKVYAVVIVLLIFIITKTVLWLIKKALFRKNNDKSFDTGNTYALFKIIKVKLNKKPITRFFFCQKFSINGGMINYLKM